MEKKMLERRVGKLRPDFNQTVLINDTTPDSQYFRVSEFPGELTSGKNMFKMYGNVSLLKPNTQILIQVTDISGNPIYHHVNKFIDSAGKIPIGIWLYPETPPGLGLIQILGCAAVRPDGRPVPQGWSNIFNVKWSKEIFVHPEKLNKTPLIFDKLPGVTIREYEREYLTQTYLTGNSVATSSDGSVSYTYNGHGSARINVTGGIFSASMAGGTITIPNPNVTLPSGYSIQPNTDSVYKSHIDTVENSSQIKVSPHVLSIEATTTVNDNQTGRSNTSTVHDILPVTSFGPVSDYTIEWQQSATYATGSSNSQSFASIIIKNLDPMVGTVDTIKTYVKSHGYADFQLMSTDKLTERDLLIDISSTLAYDRAGDFKSQEIINNFWHSESINQPGLQFANKHDDSQMISSMIITGSSDLSASVSYPGLPIHSDPYIKVYSKPDIDIYQNNEYQLKFKVVAETLEAQTQTSIMEIYVSGSNMRDTDSRNIGTKLGVLETQNSQTGVITSVRGFGSNTSDSYIPTTSISNTTLGSVTVASDFSANTQTPVTIDNMTSFDEREIEFTFTPLLDSDAHIVFAVTRGKWYISDVRLEGASDFGFTPNHTFIEIPIQTAQANDILDFKFEFFNSAGEIANVSLTTQSLDFVGSNTFISGDGNQLPGTINIGGGIIMQGFESAS